MDERIKILRKKLGLTLDKFGERLGVTKTTISRLENGVNNVTEQMLKSICREFDVNEEWLRNGTGEMFTTQDIDDEYEQICAELGIKDKRAKQIIINYWNFSDEDKALFWNFIDRLVKEEGTLKEQKSYEDKPESSGSELHSNIEAPATIEEAEAEYIKNCSNSAHKQGSTASNITADTDYAKKASNE